MPDCDYHNIADDTSFPVRHEHYKLADCKFCGCCFTVDHAFWRHSGTFQYPNCGAEYKWVCNNCGRGYHQKP